MSCSVEVTLCVDSCQSYDIFIHHGVICYYLAVCVFYYCSFVVLFYVCIDNRNVFFQHHLIRFISVQAFSSSKSFSVSLAFPFLRVILLYWSSKFPTWKLTNWSRRFISVDENIGQAFILPLFLVRRGNARAWTKVISTSVTEGWLIKEFWYLILWHGTEMT